LKEALTMAKKRKPTATERARRAAIERAARAAGVLLPQGLDGEGHPTVVIEGPLGRQVRRVCELVLLSFAGPNPNGTADHRHKDGDNGNARLDNLEWV
jgi:hypothetical protein